MNYENLDHMWMFAINDCFQGQHLNSRAGDCHEVLGWSGTILDAKANWLFNPVRRLSPSYAAGETLWYLFGREDLEMIQHYAPSYGTFSDDGQILNGAYGPRIMPQFNKICDFLFKNSNSRQAVIPIFDSSDIGHETKDMPCTCCLQFFIRNGKLHQSVYMRSNDVWLGMPYDVWAFTTIQRLIADRLRCDVGSYHHHVGSLHVYDKNREKAQEAIQKPVKAHSLEFGPSTLNFKDAEQVETYARVNKNFCASELEKFGYHSILSANLAMASKAWALIGDKHLREYCYEL